MKSAKVALAVKTPVTAFDPALEKLKGKSLFPKKLALANEQLKNIKLPPGIGTGK